jgi:hypothetical protein
VLYLQEVLAVLPGIGRGEKLGLESLAVRGLEPAGKEGEVAKVTGDGALGAAVVPEVVLEGGEAGWVLAIQMVTWPGLECCVDLYAEKASGHQRAGLCRIGSSLRRGCIFASMLPRYSIHLVASSCFACLLALPASRSTTSARARCAAERICCR